MKVEVSQRPVLPYQSGGRPRLDVVQRVAVALVAGAFVRIGALSLFISLRGPVIGTDGEDSRIGLGIFGGASILMGVWFLLVAFRKWRRRSRGIEVVPLPDASLIARRRTSPKITIEQ